MSLILLIIFFLCFVIQMLFWGGLFRRLATYQQPESTQQPAAPVSIVICAKNEAQNLQNHLPSILNQDYPQYEVLVVNDHSLDDTKSVLSRIKGSHNHLKIIHLEDVRTDRPGKKIALSTGIEAASNDFILLTDADCQPASDQWIKLMIQPFLSENADACLGFGPYYKKAGWLNRWIRYETVLTAVQYLSFARVGKPYMGVGRNLAYRKELFKLESLQPEIASGDDDLVVQSLQNKKVAIQINPKSFTYSHPPFSWKDYYRMKSRHMTSSFHYTWYFKILLSLFAGTHLGFWILFFVLLPTFPIALLLLLSLKWITQWFIFRPIALKLKEGDLVKHFWWLDVALAMYYVVMMPGLFFRDRNKW